METVLSRGIFSTRPRDYYDIYVLGTTQSYDKELFREALEATARHRGSTDNIKDRDGIIKVLSDSDELRAMWDKYQKKFPYARDIAYGQMIKVLKELVG